LNWLKLTGAIVALGGVAVIGQVGAGSRSHLLGFLAILVSATSAAFSNSLLKRGPRVPPIAINAVGCVAGLVICLTLSRVVGERSLASRRRSSRSSIARLPVRSAHSFS